MQNYPSNLASDKSAGKLRRPSWGSYWAFLLAAIGSSIGLGNIWKFPYELGAHGGGTFLLIYIPCVFLVAFPLIMAELMIGRQGRASTIESIKVIAEEERASGLWQAIAWLGILTSFLIFSYYSVVAGWILFYIMKSVSGAFVDVPAEIVQHSFGALLSNPEQLLIWHSVFVLMVVTVLAKSIRGGLERALKLLMPLLVIELIALCVYTSQFGDYQAAYRFLTTINLELIDAELVVSALTQALFSFSIGIGILMLYGSYFKDDRPLFSGSVTIMVFDTSIALVMSLLIFSTVFAFGLSPDSGPGLIFETIPMAFAQIPENNVLWSALFFILLLVAALISGFALLEPTIAALVSTFKISRRVAAWLAGSLAWTSGLLSVYSFGKLKFNFYYFNQERVNGFFDVLYILTTHVLMPLTALLIALFAGWRVSRFNAANALNLRVHIAFLIWRFCIKLIAPFIITIVLLLVLFYPAS